MNPSENPYASPYADLNEPVVQTEAEMIRRKYLNHEASLKSIGSLYYLSGIVCVFSSMGFLAGHTGLSITEIFLAVMIYGIIGTGFIFVGRGFRKLARWVRIPGTVLSVIGLVMIPLGTVINAYFLYLILSKKGRFVFSPEYKEIIQQTPHIKYKMSIITWILLILLLLLLLISIGSFLFFG